MYIRRRPVAGTSKIKLQIVESVRSGKKVSQRVVRSLGVARNEEDCQKFEKAAIVIMEEIRKERSGGLLFDSAEELLDHHDCKEFPLKQNKISQKDLKNKVSLESLAEMQRLFDGPELVYGSALKASQFAKIVSPDKLDLLARLVAQRICDPQSKRKTLENLKDKAGFEVDANKIYRFMSEIGDKETEQAIVQAAISEHELLYGCEINLLFFDVTTLYFESWTQDDLKDFGFSKDCKFGQVQVTLALASNSKGHPIGYKLFPGNTAEVKTLIECVQEWRTYLTISNVTVVADRGMFSAANLWALQQAGFKFILGCPMRKLNQSTKEEILRQDGYKLALLSTGSSEEAVWYRKITYQVSGSQEKESDEVEGSADEKKSINEREYFQINGTILATYSSRRAKKDQEDREKIIEKAIKKLKLTPDKKSLTTSSLKSLVSNKGASKYLKANISSNSSYQLDQEKIDLDAQWDGMHGVFTNIENPDLDVVARYRGLWQIEECFRISKSNLKIRPIYHYKPVRIRGHVALCFISLVILKNIQLKLHLKGVELSAKQVSDQVSQIGYSLIKDTESNLIFKLPSALNEKSKQILEALDITRSAKPQILQ